ncbi:MAG TPA: META domain-containing protein [Chloroflexi bacterium]|nr:META domain-containing protein [Chloroflexota bacterium]
MKKCITLITLFVLLTLVLPGAVMAQNPVECEVEYTVQAGDWLSKIAEKYMGDALAYEQLVELANASADDACTNIDNPDLIEPGWIICIPKVEGAAAVSGVLSEDALKNATYQGIYDEPATLTDGFYEGDPFVEGSPMRPTVTYVDAVWGDLTGDGVDDAVVFLAEASGGSGVFTYLAAVVDQDGQPVNVASVMVGDRTDINELKIENGEVVAKILTHGPDDPMCCPTRNMIKKFALQGDQLLETYSEVVDNKGESAQLTGVIWNWLGSTYSNDAKSEVTTPGDFTVTFNEDGYFNGKADCNNFGGSYTLTGNSISIQPGPMTMAMCPQQELADQFLKDLGAAAIFFFQNDNLLIDMMMDTGTMKFGK